MSITPPVAAKKPYTYQNHKETRTDNYAWLRDDNWQEVLHKPELLRTDIRDYLDAENNYTKAMMQDTEALQNELFEEMKARIKEDDETVPKKDGDYYYYRRFEKGQQYPILCRKQGSTDGEEEILLNCNEEAEGHEFYKLIEATHSTNHRYLAFAVDYNGSEYYTIRIKDLETGKTLPDAIEEATGDISWANDNDTLFYSVLDNNHRPCKVLKHKLGDDCANDTLLYEEKDAGCFLSIHKSESHRFIFIESSNSELSEIHFLDLRNPEQPLQCIKPRKHGERYDVTHHGDSFFIMTNIKGAENNQIMRTPIDNPSVENWKNYIPHSHECLIQDMYVLKHHLIRTEMKDALPRIIIRHIASGDEHAISFDEECYDVDIVPAFEYDTTTLLFYYSSLTTPSQVYSYDMDNKTRELIKEEIIPSGHNAADYICKRMTATSHDGEKVPYSILYHKDTKLDGSAPAVLYGYGSYGHIIGDSFVPHRFSLVNRGFVYAIAHIRGGKDKGYRWYKDGKTLKKKNSFYDFIACAEDLIKNKITSANRLAAHGGSAGGMLMGAVVNLRPDLFNAIVADVPFVDVLTTICDDTLPLTPPEWEEWGNPIKESSTYHYIKSYSPYDNVTAQDYPNMLITGGLTDPRVTYWEPAKWAALLREKKTDNNTLLLKINMGAGHAGASGRFDLLKERAFLFAFLLKYNK